MIELPEVRKVSDLGLGARQFRRGEQPDFSDRGQWTKAPNDNNDSGKDKDSRSEKQQQRDVEKRRREEAISKRDAEQDEMARKHKKLHKRDKSMLEIHEKKMKKEKVGCIRNYFVKAEIFIKLLFLYFFNVYIQKKAKDEKEERKPFNRETDLQVNRFDESRKKSAIKNSQLLDDRFSRGNAKYL